MVLHDDGVALDKTVCLLHSIGLCTSMRNGSAEKSTYAAALMRQGSFTSIALDSRAFKASALVRSRAAVADGLLPRFLIGCDAVALMGLTTPTREPHIDSRQ